MGFTFWLNCMGVSSLMMAMSLVQPPDGCPLYTLSSIGFESGIRVAASSGLEVLVLQRKNQAWRCTPPLGNWKLENDKKFIRTSLLSNHEVHTANHVTFDVKFLPYDASGGSNYSVKANHRAQTQRSGIRRVVNEDQI